MPKAHFENIQSTIILQLLDAKRSVKVISAYFTNKKLFDTLCSLSEKGIEVELIIADEPINTYDSKIEYSDFIDLNGKLYLTNRTPSQSLVHHKFCIIDSQKVITGSFNWTTKAPLNRENIIIINDKKIVSEYLKEFDFVKENYSEVFRFRDGIKVPWGFISIDKLDFGLKPSELICLAGRPEMGKSDFLINMFLNISGKFKIPVGVIYSNISSTNLSKRTISVESGIDTTKLIRGASLEDYEWQEAQRSEDELKDREIYFIEGGAPIDELEKQCKQLWHKGVKLLIIDGIDHLFRQGGEIKSTESNKTILERLKKLARLLRIPILFSFELSSHYSKSNSLESRRPVLNDFGIINYYADLVLSIHREEYYQILEDNEGNLLKGIAEVSILKHPHGLNGLAKFYYHPSTGKFRDLMDETEVETYYDIVKSKKLGLNEDEPPF